MSTATPEPPAAPAAPAAAPAPTPAPPADPPKETDWKAEARKWEERAKENKTKLDEATPKIEEWERLRAASQTELEKAQELATANAAKAEAATARAVRGEAKALAAATFADPDDAAAFLDLPSYVNDKGEIDAAKITTDLAALLVRKPHLAKVTGPTVPRPNPAQGTSPNGTPGFDDQIAAATKAGNHLLAIQLKQARTASLKT